MLSSSTCNYDHRIRTCEFHIKTNPRDKAGGLELALDDPKTKETMVRYDCPMRYMNTATSDRFVRELFVMEKEGPGRSVFRRKSEQAHAYAPRST